MTAGWAPGHTAAGGRRSKFPLAAYSETIPDQEVSCFVLGRQFCRRDADARPSGMTGAATRPKPEYSIWRVTHCHLCRASGPIDGSFAGSGAHSSLLCHECACSPAHPGVRGKTRPNSFLSSFHGFASVMWSSGRHRDGKSGPVELLDPDQLDLNICYLPIDVSTDKRLAASCTRAPGATPLGKQSAACNGPSRTGAIPSNSVCASFEIAYAPSPLLRPVSSHSLLPRHLRVQSK